ncbi:hypothetical protein ARMGADRAFT_1033044 [Armillaria gallica]|uniref:Uncharacterized protein n=1 Tax=Armillaria gallica TaxID=47427 RepID=A0A2H3DPT8_ARMGA|nr:hypothetical protein ARMGADRAFT_1033044 [Armillaria gallica]
MGMSNNDGVQRQWHQLICASRKEWNFGARGEYDSSIISSTLKNRGKEMVVPIGVAVKQRIDGQGVSDNNGIQGETVISIISSILKNSGGKTIETIEVEARTLDMALVTMTVSRVEMVITIVSSIIKSRGEEMIVPFKVVRPGFMRGVLVMMMALMGKIESAVISGTFKTESVENMILVGADIEQWWGIGDDSGIKQRNRVYSHLWHL